MKNVLVGVFGSAEHARAAHATLLGEGFRNGQVGVEDSAPAAELTGPAGLIARMFSGFLLDDALRGRDYAASLARGGGIVALHDLDDVAEARATAILQQHGAARVESHAAPGDAPAGGALPPARGTNAERELAEVASVGPRAYVLPNAPTDWGRYTGRSRASIGQDGDPARPEGELRDAVGLDPQADRAALLQQSRRQR